MQALLQRRKVPIQIVTEDGEDAAQIPLHRHQQTDIHGAVLDDIQSVGRRLLHGGTVQRVGDIGLLRRRGHRRDVVGVLGKKGAEHLVHQQGHRGGSALRPLQCREVDAEDLLAVIGAIRHAVDGQMLAGGKVVIAGQLPIGRSLHPDIRRLAAELQAPDIPQGAHVLAVADVAQGIAAHLTIGGATIDVVGGTAQQHLSVGRHRQHFIVLAVKGEELARQILLEHMTPKLGTQIMGLAVLVLRNVAGVLQVLQHQPAEQLVLNVPDSLRLAGLHGEAALAPQHPAAKEKFLSAGGQTQQRISVVVHESRITALHTAAQHLPQGIRRFPRIGSQQHQLPVQLPIRHRFNAHAQAQPQRYIALRAGVIRHDVRNGLGIGVEDPLVGSHIVPQKIVGGDDIDEALLPDPGGKVPLHLKHIEGLVLHHHVLVFLHSGIP